ncbi:uncharacterized protein B0P05DRAFT_520798 [Gilbertella persicaria]|uniref:uncharacterized protein n=1 Tax=Gilbertella persicaria TaxID=101096 RepID=UPI0022208077|nr:uncharacterized protein B0P05DRAFT_520798 [Gilbertella persicaria]KAI8098175.1 hypothetical protein B0P05DRAFT_520798 [Gilbertella persicaria]
MGNPSSLFLSFLVKMNKEAIAKHAFKSFASNAQQSENSKYQAHLNQQQAKKYWWNKAPAPDSILTKEERKLLKKVKSRAHFLDRAVSCCCFQIGFDGLIGLVPVIGDFLGLLMALNLVHLCMQANLPNELVSKMMFNITLDFVIGLVPVLGDILDIMYKCNTKNAILFESYLLKRRRLEAGNYPQINAKQSSASAISK